MAKFTLTGFADEIDPALSVQMDVLDRLDIHYIETRGIDGKNISDYTPAEAKTIHARLADRGFAVSALGSPIGKIGVNDPFAPHLDNFRRLIDVAHELDTRYIRMFSFYTPQGEDPAACRDEVMQRLSALVEANRGSGVTLACGTGSCAALVAASLCGLADRRAHVVLDGGELVDEWDEATGHLFMTGAATHVFDGVVDEHR